MYSNNEEYEVIIDIIDQLERMYTPLMDSDSYHEESISSVLDKTFDYLETLDEDIVDDELTALNVKASNTFGQLCIMFHNLQYFDIAFSVFAGFPSAVELSFLSFRFTTQQYDLGSTQADDKKFIAILDFIENNYPEYQLSLPYRTFKLLYILRIFGASVYVSILSKFILQQFSAILIQNEEE